MAEDRNREPVRDPVDPATARPGGPPHRDRDAAPGGAEPAEKARRPVPGVKHEPEPDAENIMPAEDEPGTL